MIACKVCNKEFETERQLHAHLKAHKLTMVEYYQQYYPRHDLYDGKIIKFKNKAQYLSTDFNSRTNLRMWMKSKPEDEAKEYCTSLMKKRIEKKGIEYAPTQVELRTIMSPPIQYHDKLFGSYNDFCEDLGLKTKFVSPGEIVEDSKWKDSQYKIYVDTREQKPLKFKDRQVEIKTLKFGDYAFSSKEATCNCYIERKNLSDFIGTISGGYERFINEIERAKEAEAYLVVLVEDTLTNSLSFPFLRHISKKIKATPEFIFNRVRGLTQSYPHLQFLFVKGRVESSRIIEKIFTSGCVHEKIDLQLAYDTKKL